MSVSSGRNRTVILALILGPLISAAATAAVFVVPVGARCGGAFATNHGQGTLRLEAACVAAAQAPKVTYFVVIGLCIAIVIFAIARWVLRPEPVSRVFVAPEITGGRGRSATPLIRGERRTEAAPRHGPRWPFILGPLVSAAGVVMGLIVPVGDKCSGAFAGSHGQAIGHDIAYALSGAGRSYLADACVAAAPGQRGIYWGIIGFGLAMVMFGILLRSLENNKLAVVSVAEELNRLDGLRIRGILTAAEFENRKQHLLRF